MEAYIGLAIITAIFYGIGITLQKKGVSKISGKFKILDGFSINLDKVKKLLKEVLNKYLVLGLVLNSIGGLFFMASVSMGEISTIVPLLNLNLVIVYTLGAFYLKEKLRFREWFGVGIIFFGVVVLSLVT
jgi:uncharacterized membrane protein